MNARLRFAMWFLVSWLVPLTIASARQDPPTARPISKATSTISGRVEWPDGSPAVGAMIAWSPEVDDDIGSWLGGGRNVRATLLDGSFELKRLKGSAYRIEVSATRADDHSVWIASATNVAVGNTSVKLLLHESAKITGRVVDDLDQPVVAFVVKPTRVYPHPSGRGMTQVAGAPLSVVDEQGRFVLTGLMEGFHQIRVTTTDGRESDPVAIELPGSTEPLLIKLPRLASVAGRVVDPAGKPVVGATITLRTPEVTFRFDVDKPPPIVSDATGAFRIDRLRPIRQLVRASSPAWANSDEIAVDLAPGATTSDIVLTLRTGGSIVGEWVDEAGRPRKGGTVQARRTSIDAPWTLTPVTAKVDAKGQFRFDRLAPGEYELSRAESKGSGMGMSVDDLDRLLEDEPMVSASEATLRVVVIDGETTHVVLGRPVEPAMRGRGFVRMGGRPLAGIRVAATKMYDNEEFKQSEATTTADGTFSLGLDEPGTHYFELDLGPVQHLCTRVVTEEREQTFDFDYVVGRISGRVFGADGKPMAQAPVRLASSLSSRGYAVFDTNGNTETDAEGRFAFDRLPQATYRVDAGEATDGAAGLAPKYAQATRDGIVVTAGGDLEVELRPTLPCTVLGRVVDTKGQPLAAMSVFARGEAGTLVSTEALAKTGRDGAFRITGLPLEKVTFFARDDARATPESAPVALDPEHPAAVELVAVPATRLWIQAQSERETSLTRYQVRVFDAQGRDVRLSTWRQAPDDGEVGWLESVLPPGKYRVLVRQLGRKDAEVTLEVSGEPHVSRVLTLPLAQ